MDYAQFLKESADRYFANAKTVVPVQDNANHTKANWQFSTPKDSIKLKHLYPAI